MLFVHGELVLIEVIWGVSALALLELHQNNSDFEKLALYIIKPI